MLVVPHATTFVLLAIDRQQEPGRDRLRYLQYLRRGQRMAFTLSAPAAPPLFRTPRRLGP